MVKKKSRKYPENAVIEDWFVSKDSGQWAVKRFIKRNGRVFSVERLPIDQYRDYRENEKELRDFVTRKNGRDPKEERAKELSRYRNAFLAPELMKAYRDHYLPAHIPTKKDAGTMFKYLREYALDWFVLKRGLSNPLYWHRHQDEWAKYLLNNREAVNFNERYRLFEPGVRMSAKVLRQIVNEMNRFMKFLHMKRASEVPPLKFQPFSAATLKMHDAERKLDDEFRDSKYVKPEHWELINKEMERRKVSWRYAILLCHRYGLRRNEALGLNVGDVKRGFLSVERQYDRKIVVGEMVVPVSRKKSSIAVIDENSGDEVSTASRKKKRGRPKLPKMKTVCVKEVKFRPLKDREERSVPHWFSTPAETHALIHLVREKIVHPDTITREFTALVEDLNIPAYVVHDLRRTWVTNALKAKHDPEEVRLAAGHSTIHTTYRFYVEDTREFDEEVWTPESDGAA